MGTPIELSRFIPTNSTPPNTEPQAPIQTLRGILSPDIAEGLKNPPKLTHNDVLGKTTL